MEIKLKKSGKVKGSLYTREKGMNSQAEDDTSDWDFAFNFCKGQMEKFPLRMTAGRNGVNA